VAEAQVGAWVRRCTFCGVVHDVGNACTDPRHVGVVTSQCLRCGTTVVTGTGWDYGEKRADGTFSAIREWTDWRPRTRVTLGPLAVRDRCACLRLPGKVAQLRERPVPSARTVADWGLEEPPDMLVVTYEGQRRVVTPVYLDRA
jgi:hypothetical protein